MTSHTTSVIAAWITMPKNSRPPTRKRENAMQNATIGNSASTDATTAFRGQPGSGTTGPSNENFG